MSNFRTRQPVPPSGNTWVIQIGNHEQREYKTVLTTDRAGQALITYGCIHVHSGGKKRILRNGKVVARHLTSATGRADTVEQLTADALAS